jgi:hypothetical protein
MFSKNSIYKPLGKCKSTVYKPNLYDDEVTNPFEEIDISQEYLDFFKRENSHLYSDSINLNAEDVAKDDILEYILREYS